MLNEVFPCTEGACSFAPRDLGNASKRVAFGSWPGELLEMCKVLHDQALLFPGDGARSTLLLQEQHPLAILVEAAMHTLLVSCKVLLVEKISALAQLAHYGATDRRFGSKGAQFITQDSVAWHVAAASSKGL